MNQPNASADDAIPARKHREPAAPELHAANQEPEQQPKNGKKQQERKNIDDHANDGLVEIVSQRGHAAAAKRLRRDVFYHAAIHGKRHIRVLQHRMQLFGRN
ncbi:hypothetical protein SDC9_156238 [bioreactor metagenome]|uniref:Uncharacterized protein n=1 Tax=bioreactor metagenome TaxID=1076179 RepID=A0A645F517_9ZZZZ